MSVNVALALLCLAACKGKEHQVRSQDPTQALAVSISYAKAHYTPKAFHSGNAYLAYFVEDHGDIWITEISPQGQMGGGLRIIVRKQDMKVVDAARTQ